MSYSTVLLQWLKLHYASCLSGLARDLSSWTLWYLAFKSVYTHPYNLFYVLFMSQCHRTISKLALNLPFVTFLLSAWLTDVKVYRARFACNSNGRENGCKLQQPSQSLKNGYKLHQPETVPEYHVVTAILEQLISIIWSLADM